MLTVKILGYLASYGHLQISAMEIEKTKSGISIAELLFVTD